MKWPYAPDGKLLGKKTEAVEAEQGKRRTAEKKSKKKVERAKDDDEDGDEKEDGAKKKGKDDDADDEKEDDAKKKGKDDEKDDDDDAKQTTKRAAKAWRSSFNVDKKNLASVGRNPYFVLVPGYKLHLAGGGETVVISVLDETKTVDGVETRVVEERETKDGKLAEVSRNYFAIDKTTHDVYYFGEDVDEYENGKVTGHGGAWLSGEAGAKFGLMMPGKPAVGDKFYNEIAPKKAMDRAEVVDLNATLKTPLKQFAGVLYVQETTPLNRSEVSKKWYAPGVGMIGDDSMRVVRIEEVK